MSWPEWWEWPLVQWWWWKRYQRADRKAFARECAQIRWCAVMKPTEGDPS